MFHKQIFNILKADSKKLYSLSHHYQNYQTYLFNNVIPKGLQLKSIHNIGHTSQYFNSKWNSTLDRCSKNLLTILRDNSLNQILFLERKICNTRNLLQNSCSPIEFALYLEKLSHFVNKHRESIDNVQRRKFERDNIFHVFPYRQPLVNILPRRKSRNRRFKRNQPINDVENSTVLNLSSTPLSEDEESLLSKGLGFCPTPSRLNIQNLREDMDSFFRRLRLKEYFARKREEDGISEHSDSDTDDADINDVFKKKSTWTPKCSKSIALESYIDAVTEKVEINMPRQDFPISNLNEGEFQALKHLEKREDIVIKKADKGSTVVVMNTNDYIDEANRQLSQSAFYKKIKNDPTKKHSDEISKALRSMFNNGELDEDNFSGLLPENPRAGLFYLLPKIHKEGIPGRPIINCIGHPTEKISHFLDLQLQPFVQSLPSFIKDTTDFINKTPSENLPPNTLLVTLDVTSLYTNIPHDEGIEACRKVWDSRAIKSPPTESLVNLLSLVLKRNNFVFNDEHFLQVNGTAMGTRVAPSYANIFMGDLEKRMLQEAPFKPYSWLRFIDDIEMKWTDTRSHLDEFIEFINNYHPSIKFTVNVSENSIFLDTTSTLVDGNIKFDLHTKPTDTHAYLLPSSCHPRHCVNAVPYGLSTRIRRICSDDQTFKQRSKELKQRLIRRGYKAHRVEETIQKVSTSDRKELLQYQSKKKKSSRVPLVTTFHPKLPDLSAITRECLPALHVSSKMKALFPEPPLISFRRPKNLKDILVRAKLPTSETQQFKTCNDRRCQLCKYSVTTSTFQSTATGDTYRIFSNLSCKSVNVIYLITCSICQEQYIGETGGPLNIRINLHRDHIRKKDAYQATAVHFNTAGHSWTDMQVVAIDQNRSWSVTQRRAKEKHWMDKLKSSLNIRFT